MSDPFSTPLQESIDREGARAIRRRSFSETLGVSDEQRLEGLRKARAYGPGPAERAHIRFGKVIEEFRKSEGRSPTEKDMAVWRAFATILRQEQGGRARARAESAHT